VVTNDSYSKFRYSSGHCSRLDSFPDSFGSINLVNHNNLLGSRYPHRYQHRRERLLLYSGSCKLRNDPSGDAWWNNVGRVCRKGERSYCDAAVAGDR